MVLFVVGIIVSIGMWLFSGEVGKWITGKVQGLDRKKVQKLIQAVSVIVLLLNASQLFLLYQREQSQFATVSGIKEALEEKNIAYIHLDEVNEKVQLGKTDQTYILSSMKKATIRDDGEQISSFGYSEIIYIGLKNGSEIPVYRIGSGVFEIRIERIKKTYMMESQDLEEYFIKGAFFELEKK